MSVVCKSDNGGLRVYTKGAVDVLLAKCNLSEEEKERIYQANEKLASMALRVLVLLAKILMLHLKVMKVLRRTLYS